MRLVGGKQVSEMVLGFGYVMELNTKAQRH
jgi:hypothetical protein